MISPALQRPTRLQAALKALPAPFPAAWLAGGVLAALVALALPADARRIELVLVGSASTVALLTAALRRDAGRRLPWLLFAAGVLSHVVGDAIVAVYQVGLDRAPPQPSSADFFRLAAFPFLAAGIVVLLRRIGGSPSRAALLDASIVVVALGVVQGIFFVNPYVHMGLEGTRLGVLIAYPIVDGLLVIAFALLFVAPGARTPAYRLLLLSTAAWIVAADARVLQVAGYGGDVGTDALWVFAYAAWGAPAVERSMAALAEPDRRAVPRLTAPRFALLTAALLTAPAVLATERLAHHSIHALTAAVGAAAIAILVLFRLVGLVRSHDRARRAERHSRRDAEFAQKLLVAQNERLRELDELKDEFVSSVTHELRTPLTSISGYVELLLDEVEDSEERAYLQIVDRNAQRLLALVNDLLFAARLQSGRLELELEPVDLRGVVEEAVEAARPRADAADVELVVTCAEVPAVTGERQRLGQLVDNLLSNAIKFTPAGGHVDIALAGLNGLVHLEVSDTGIGIPADEMARLFERFFRTQSALERQIQGTGLGLYISKAIVDAHGGRIAVRSDEGRGTTFVVELPIG
jgi:signal transduction histidine kinase